VKFIKKNKFIVIVICIVLIILLTSFYSVARLLFPDLGTPIYGDRLENIDKMILTNDKKISIINNIKLNDIVEEASLDIKGILINIVVSVKEGTDVSAAKNIGTKVLTQFTTEEKEFYDIQFFITQNTEEENTLYPLIGYKNKLSPTFVWTGK